MREWKGKKIQEMRRGEVGGGEVVYHKLVAQAK